MIFWVFAITMTAAVVYAIIAPLRRKADDRASTADYDVAVFKSQLREVERDLERGRVTAEEAEASRVEIGRRLLAADKRRETAAAADRRAGPLGRAMAAIIIAGGVTVGAVVYDRSGDPGNPDMPLVLRQAERVLAEGGGSRGQGGTATEAQSQAGSLDRAANQLRARLASGEGDPEDWSLLGRTEMMRGEYAAAASAYQEALKTFPDDADLNAAYGEALVLWAGGTVTDNAYLVFEKVARLAPLDPRARFYIAEFDRQEGRFKEALDAWVLMLQSAPPEAPWAPMVRERAEELADQMGIDLSERIAPLDTAADGVGPTNADIVAAREMSEDDRQAMIRGMVDGLAERLAEDPSDFDGWMRLIRSQTVLGDMAAAQETLDQAAGHFAAGPVPTRMLGELAAELGLNMPGAGAESQTNDGPRGPTEEDVAAAQAMEESDRQAMIAGMVEQLAERLEDNPDDLEGWTMLGRSYGVLGRGEEAVAALTRASELSPNDPLLLIDRARILRSLAGEQQTPETVALMARVAELDPNNTEALWFLGLDRLRAGDRDAARALMERAVETIPENAPERTSLTLQIENLFSQ